MNWDAIAAIATAIATIVALWASTSALEAPEKQKLADRKEGTLEILRAAEDSLVLHKHLCDLIEKQKKWPDTDVVSIRIKADHLRMTLDRLLSRAHLSDGAIAVGAGCMSILSTIGSIESHGEMLTRRRAELSKDSRERMMAMMLGPMSEAAPRIIGAKAVASVVRERMEKVRAYVETY